MKYYQRYIFVLITISINNCSAQPKNEQNPEITSKEIQEHINYLASDELEGRLTGTPAAEKAAAI